MEVMEREVLTVVRAHEENKPCWCTECDANRIAEQIAAWVWE